jgi:hypothetical protein
LRLPSSLLFFTLIVPFPTLTHIPPVGCRSTRTSRGVPIPRWREVVPAHADRTIDHVATKGHEKGNVEAKAWVVEAKVRKAGAFLVIVRSSTLRLNTERLMTQAGD